MANACTFGGALMVSLTLCTGAASAAQQPVSEPPAVTQSITEASLRFAVPADWIRAVIKVESGGNPKAVSPKGAMGLMQIMPATWEPLRLHYHLGANPYDVHDNIVAGTALLRELYDRFGGAGFLAAYNAGPSRYLSFLNAGEPLKEETRSYLTKLALLLGGTLAEAILTPVRPRDWRGAPIFLATLPANSNLAFDLPSSSNSAAAAVHDPASPAPLGPGNAGLFVTLTAKVSP